MENAGHRALSEQEHAHSGPPSVVGMARAWERSQESHGGGSLGLPAG